MLQIYRVSSHKVQFLNLNTKTKLAKNTEMTQCEAVSVCFESSDWLIFEFGATSLQPISIGPGIRVRRIKVQRSVVLPQWSATVIKEYPKIVHLHLLHIFDRHLLTSFSFPEDESTVK